MTGFHPRQARQARAARERALRRGGQDDRRVVGDDDGVLVMRREAAVERRVRPAVGGEADPAAARRR